MKAIYQEPGVELYQGDALSVLRQLPTGIASMVMTSPPYYSMRSYSAEPMVFGGDPECEHRWGDTRNLGNNRQGLSTGRVSRKANNPSIQSGNICIQCGAYSGQLGLEPDPDMFISHLCDIFDEVKRVLKKTGTLWVNLDDSMAGSGGGHKEYHNNSAGFQGTTDPPKGQPAIPSDVPAKSLLGIPERFVLEMMRRGWIRRNTIIWYKKSVMPESVKDRFTIDFEYLYMFSQTQRYFFEQQFEPLTVSTIGRYQYDSGYNPKSITARQGEDKKYFSFPKRRGLKTKGQQEMGSQEQHHGQDISANQLGRNHRSVWTINPRSYSGPHYASYPPELCRTPILAGCPLYICTKCGKPRKKMYKTEPMKIRRSTWGEEDGNRTASSGTMLEPNKVEFIGYSDCGCSEPFESGVVLDPFAGTSTTLAVAKELGRKSIGIELSEKYVELSIKRIQATKTPLL